jgi:hypothetical protein
VYGAIVSDGADGARETGDFSFRVIDAIETRLGEYEYATVAHSDGFPIGDGREERGEGNAGTKQKWEGVRGEPRMLLGQGVKGLKR